MLKTCTKKYKSNSGNVGTFFYAYQFEPDWDPEDISEEDRAEPVQARLLMVCLVVVVSYF